MQSQQLPDTTFQIKIKSPAFPFNTGPLVVIDQAHNNHALIDENYRPFASLLRQDGYRVTAIHETFSAVQLSPAKILIIMNALGVENINNWKQHGSSAFTEEEIIAVREWVHKGGALLLVADHMPFPAAAEKLAMEFGIEFSNGFAVHPDQWGPLVFRRSEHTLLAHPINNGRNISEQVDSVVTFWGQAFRVQNKQSAPLLVFSKGVISLHPDTAWRFNESTPSFAVDGWLQGAAMKYGTGRVVVMGEAGMLSAQITGANKVPMGMNHRRAKQNPQFVLNVMHWLSGLIPDQ